MWFYFGVVGLLLVSWIVYVSLTGARAILTVSLLGLISFVVILAGIRQGYMRGRKKEIFFACTIIILFGARNFLRDFLVGFYNFTYDFIIGATNRQGWTKINIEATKWRLDASSANIFELMIFFGGCIGAYAYITGKDGGNSKDIFGAILGGIGSALFLTYSFMLLAPYLGGIYNTSILNNTNIDLPDIRLPDVQFRSQGSASPFTGWDKWLPVALMVLLTFYTVFFVFARPLTRTGPDKKTRVDVFTILGIVLVLVIAWRFALVPKL